MLLRMIEEIFLLLSLVAVAVALYYGIEKLVQVMEMSRLEAEEYIRNHTAAQAEFADGCMDAQTVFAEEATAAQTGKAVKGKDIQSVQDDGEVKHATEKNRRRKGSGMHLLFSKQPEGDQERGKVRSGKQPFSHGFIR